MKTARQIAAEYRTFIADTGGVCWRCGRTARDKPDWWHSDWWIHRAHLDECNHPRRNDRRAIIAACPLCHAIQHRHRFPYDLTDGGKFPGCTAIPMTIEEMLWLKRDRDPSFFEPEFLASCAIKRELVLRICRELAK